VIRSSCLVTRRTYTEWGIIRAISNAVKSDTVSSENPKRMRLALPSQLHTELADFSNNVNSSMDPEVAED